MKGGWLGVGVGWDPSVGVPFQGNRGWGGGWVGFECWICLASKCCLIDRWGL